MPATSATVTDEDLLEAFVLLQRYSLELDRVAANALGQGPTGSVDLEILLAIARAGDASPSGLVEVLGMPRSTLARGLARLRRATARFGLTEAPDRHAVVHLALRDSRPSLIAEHINLTPAGTTSLLDRLEALGLVERRTGLWPADRRAVLVRLTPPGRRCRPRGVPPPPGRRAGRRRRLPGAGAVGARAGVLTARALAGPAPGDPAPRDLLGYRARCDPAGASAVRPDRPGERAVA